MKTSIGYINMDLLWAVSDAAKLDILALIKLGIDFDIAFAVVEDNLPEESFWIAKQEVELETSRHTG